MNLFLLLEMPMLGDRQCLLYSVANHDIIIFAAAVSGSHPLTFSQLIFDTTPKTSQVGYPNHFSIYTAKHH